MADEKTTYILIVDDNPASGTVFERVVKRVPRCFPKIFTSPHEALVWAKSHRPALVVVDYRMPEMDGLEFIRTFRTIPERNRVPFVMLTGMKGTDIRGEALKLGVVAFLEKPVNPEILVAHIANALREP